MIHTASALITIDAANTDSGLWIPDADGIADSTRWLMGLRGFITKKAQRQMLNGLAGENEKHSEGAGNEAFRLGVFKGNPGEAGLANKADGGAVRAFIMPFVTEEAAPEGRKNSNAIEFAEVVAKETYTFVGLQNALSEFMGFGELTAPVAVEVGDTFKINIGNLIVKVE
jgi:hypothetical protein